MCYASHRKSVLVCQAINFLSWLSQFNNSFCERKAFKRQAENPGLRREILCSSAYYSSDLFTFQAAI
jgi:hypothetical protein